MFIADDVVLFPFKSLLKVFREIYNAAVQEMEAESDGIRNELSQLYLALEAGTLSEDAFDARERELLDRLDLIEERARLERGERPEGEEVDEDDEEDEFEDEDGDTEDEEEEDEDDEDAEDEGVDYIYERSDDEVDKQG